MLFSLSFDLRFQFPKPAVFRQPDYFIKLSILCQALFSFFSSCSLPCRREKSFERAAVLRQLVYVTTPASLCQVPFLRFLQTLTKISQNCRKSFFSTLKRPANAGRSNRFCGSLTKPISSTALFRTCTVLTGWTLSACYSCHIP